MNKHRDTRTVFTRELASSHTACGMASHVSLALYDFLQVSDMHVSRVRYTRISEITCVQIVRTAENFEYLVCVCVCSKLL